VSTSTLGGHVDTISNQAGGARRRRRLHSDEFKADAVAARTQPGVSMAAVALSRGVNANLLRRWVREAELRSTSKTPMIEARPEVALPPQAPAAFVPLQLPAPAAKEIRVELRRGSTAVTVTWPAEAAGECALWIRELLR
jgi:transposase-like protein